MSYDESELTEELSFKINDGDNEQIELTGQYKDNKFEINSVTANGYTIDLK